VVQADQHNNAAESTEQAWSMPSVGDACTGIWYHCSLASAVHCHVLAVMFRSWSGYEASCPAALPLRYAGPTGVWKYEDDCLFMN